MDLHNIIYLILKLIDISKEILCRSDLLKGRLSPQDKRYGTFKKALELMEERDAKVLVETGTARRGDRNFKNDGGSTVIFSHFAKQRRCQFFSVDRTKKNLIRAKRSVRYFLPAAQFIRSDSVRFLKNFSDKIDFLYLDSFDFDENNPLPSQNHHLEEIKAAYEKLSPQSVVMIDDCGLPHGGKGTKAIEYLKQKGWKVQENGYQVILTRT